MAIPPDDAARMETLRRATASLEEVLATLREDPRAYAAIAAAIAFVEVVIDRRAVGRGTESLPPPTGSIPPARGSE
jgi:hypothetical protein